MNYTFDIYFIVKADRLEAMLTCSLKKKVDWCEEGMALASWSYEKIAEVQAEDISQAYGFYKDLNLDKRRKTPLRSIGIGDVICTGDEAWMVVAYGFILIPEILWKKTKKITV